MLGAGAGIAGFSSLGSLLGCAHRPGALPPPSSGRRVLADLHVHPSLNAWLATTPVARQSPLLYRLAKVGFNKSRVSWESIHHAGVDLVCAAHYNPFDELASMPTDPDPEAPAHTMRMLDLLEEDLRGGAAPFARLARNRQELRALLDARPGDPARRVAVVHSLEGGHALGGDPRTLEAFARRGVAMITITHFFNKGIASAPNAFPFFPDADSQWPHQGLSELGREVVAEMERLGILVDVTHASATARADVLAVSTRPVVATHAASRTLADHPNAFFDEHIQEIARRGGVIGVILSPFALSNFAADKWAAKHGSLREVVRTIRYITKICGSHRCVGIGSDFAGFIPGPSEMTSLGEIGRLRDLLLDEFSSEEVVEAIMAGNVIEFLLENWRSGSVG